MSKQLTDEYIDKAYENINLTLRNIFYKYRNDFEHDDIIRMIVLEMNNITDESVENKIDKIPGVDY